MCINRHIVGQSHAVNLLGVNFLIYNSDKFAPLISTILSLMKGKYMDLDLVYKSFVTNYVITP